MSDRIGTRPPLQHPDVLSDHDTTERIIITSEMLDEMEEAIAADDTDAMRDIVARLAKRGKGGRK